MQLSDKAPQNTTLKRDITTIAYTLEYTKKGEGGTTRINPIQMRVSGDTHLFRADRNPTLMQGAPMTRDRSLYSALTTLLGSLSVPPRTGDAFPPRPEYLDDFRADSSLFVNGDATRWKGSARLRGC